MNTITLSNLGNGIVEVKLNRPEKHNAMSFLMIKELIKAAKQIKKDRSVRVVLLSGEGKSFCAGIDLNDLRDPKNKLKAFFAFLSPIPNFFQNMSLVWRSLPVPVISVVHGNCFGAGMQLILGTDFRIADSKTNFSIMEAKWGLIPDMGISVPLKSLIGLDKAKELTMTARIFDADEAQNLGFLTYSVDNPREKALALAEEIIGRSPDAVAGVKKLYNSIDFKSKGTILFLERILQMRLVMGKNVVLSEKKDKDPNVKFVNRKIG